MLNRSHTTAIFRHRKIQPCVISVFYSGIVKAVILPDLNQINHICNKDLWTRRSHEMLVIMWYASLKQNRWGDWVKWGFQNSNL